jgi:hypothetical protein
VFFNSLPTTHNQTHSFALTSLPDFKFLFKRLYHRNRFGNDTGHCDLSALGIASKFYLDIALDNGFLADHATNPKLWNIGLVGYGEVGRILAEDLRKQDVQVTAYDIKLRSDQTRGALRDHASAHGVALTASHADLAAQADFIVSAVTASQAVPVAQACAGAVKRGAWFLDFNSASPGAKKRAADLIDGGGGRYVEGAVMTSIPPKRIKVPLLLGGAGAAELAPLLVELGFDAKLASKELGVASAVKMCRSVMIKGLEAMVTPRGLTASRMRCWRR